jgi:hypothetical protein
MQQPIPDLGAVRDFLRDWSSGDVPLDSLRMDHIKIGGDGTLRVLYEGPGRGNQTLRITARRLKSSSGRRLEAEINERCGTFAHAATGFTQGAIYDPDQQLLFQVFPADRRLDHLPTASDAVAMAGVLERALARRSGGARIAGVAVEAVRYKPQNKCLFRYDITWAAGAGESAPDVVYARVTQPGKFHRTRGKLPQLSAVAHTLVTFELPEPLGEVPELCMQLFSRVPGVRLFALTESPEYPELCARVGAGLHEFHQLPVILDEVWGRDATLDRLAESAAGFADMMPSACERIRAVDAELVRRLQTTAPGPLRPIHGDFHGNNILVDGDRLPLVDLEDCVMGDPADDVGCNWAELVWLEFLAAPANNPYPAAGRRSFLASYLALCDEATASSIPVHAAMHCFLYGYQCLRHPHDTRRFIMSEAMLRTCEDVLEHGMP